MLIATKNFCYAPKIVASNVNRYSNESMKSSVLNVIILLYHKLFM